MPGRTAAGRFYRVQEFFAPERSLVSQCFPDLSNDSMLKLDRKKVTISCGDVGARHGKGQILRVRRDHRVVIPVRITRVT